MNKKTLIITPTFNEEQNIASFLKQIKNLDVPLSVLIVDDNSNDKTQTIIRNLQSQYKDIHLVVRQDKKRSFANSYKDGFKWALENDFEIIIEMDADLSHPIKTLPEMITKCETKQMIIGSRYIKGGQIDAWTWSRRSLSKFGNWYTRRVLGESVFDFTSGFVAYQKEVLQKLDWSKIKADGYGFQIEMKFYCLQAKITWEEIPIIFTDRVHGSSKLSRQSVWEALFIPWRLSKQKQPS